MPSNNFLFINKDVSSKSLSNNRTGESLAYSRINKHVQRLSARQRHRHKARGSTATQSPIDETSPRPTSSHSLDAYTSTFVAESVSSSNSDEDVAETIIGVPESGVEILNGITTSPTISAPLATIDSLPTTAIRLNASDHKVIQYFLQVWMPSDKHIPPNCQITGFTPIWPNDLSLSSIVVQGGLQTNDGLAVHALLAAGARRMQALHSHGLDSSGLPELHVLRAVQILRKRTESPTTLTERTILDISYLILADLYSKTPLRSDILWKISRDLIVQFGGLQNITPFITMAAIAYDYFLSVGTLTMPAIDPIRDVALLGIDPDTPPTDANVLAHAQLAKLEPRLRMTAQIKHTFGFVVQQINTLPHHAVERFKGVVSSNVPKLYPLMAGPFSRVEDTVHDMARDAANRVSLMAADSLSIQTRNLICHAWLWYSALACASALSPTPGQPQPQYDAPQHVTNVSQAWKELDEIEALLAGTGWEVQKDLLLWMDATGFLLADNETDRHAYQLRFQRQAAILGVDEGPGLEDAFAVHMPLSQLEPRWLEMLSSVVEQSGQG